MEERNNTDFQNDIAQKVNNKEQILVSDIKPTDTEDKSENNEAIEEKSNISQSNSSDMINVEQTILNEQEIDKNCNLDKAKYDKMKNWFLGSIPFILAAIIISIFNIGRVRQPLSFLFLALGLIELSITNFVIAKKIGNCCNCKNCNRQSKSSLKYAIIYGVGAIGLLGVFIYYMIKP